MAKKQKTTAHLTDLELAIMNQVWDAETWIDVEAVQLELEKVGRKLAPPSIRTMLGILVDKDFLEKEIDGRRTIFRALVPRDQAQRELTHRVVESAFDGSAVDLVAALLKSGQLKKTDLDRVRGLMAEAERKKKR